MQLKTTIQKMCDRIIGKRAVLNSYYPLVLLLYFLVVFLPNITVNIPILNHLNNSAVQIVYRVFFAVCFGLYSLLVYIANKINVPRSILLAIIFVYTILFLSVFLNLYSIASISYNNYYEKVYTEASIGIIDIISFLGNFLISFIFMISIFFVVPIVLNQTSKFIFIFEVFIYIMLGLTILSFLLDFKQYLDVWSLRSVGYEENGIHSLFASKNAFGEFLFQGFMISLIMSHFVAKKKKTLFLLCTILFGVVMVATLCKNAIIGSVIFLTFYCSFSVFHFKRNLNNVLNLIIFCFLFLLLVFLLIFIILQPDRNNPIFKIIYNMLGSNPIAGGDTSLEGRFKIVEIFFTYASVLKIFFGYAQALPNHVFMWSFAQTGGNYGNSNLHNSYLYVLGTGGIFYLFFYLIILFQIAVIIRRLGPFNKRFEFMFFAVLAAYLFYSLFETSVLVLSGSSATYMLSLLLGPFVMSTLSEHGIMLRLDKDHNSNFVSVDL